MAEIKLMGKRDIEPEFTDNIRTLTDDDYNRVAYWAAVKYFPQGILATTKTMDENGVEIETVTARQPTGAEIFRALTDAVYADIKRQAEEWYLLQAEAAARASVTPIVLNPPE